MSGSESEIEQPQCRALEQTLVYCPLCRKGPIQLKTFQYSHKCGKTFDRDARIKEAVAALEARTKRHEPTLEAKRHEPTQPLLEAQRHEPTQQPRQGRYAHLLQGWNR